MSNSSDVDAAALAYLNFGRDKLLSQETLDHKISDTALRGAIAAGFMFALGWAMVGPIGDSSVTGKILVGILAVAFIVAAALAARIGRPQNTWCRPDPMQEMEADLQRGYSPREVIIKLGNAYKSACAYNDRVIDYKAKLLRILAIAIGTQLIALVIVTFIQLFS